MISVLYDPLFQAAHEDGHTKWHGLIDLLTNAHDISDLEANSCTGKAALYRLCIAFLSEVYQPQSPEDRADILEAGRFDRQRMLDYVKACEDGGACFLLDDDKNPFMQSAYDESLDAKAEKPVAKLMFDTPSGNNHIHLEHRHEDAHQADTALAFEAMLETYLFCPAGLSGASNVNNTPPVFALLHGGNLFETLVLNMVSVDEIGNIPYGFGEAAWVRGEKVTPGEKTAQMSLMKALTWQPRRVTLRWDEDGQIRRVYLQNGLNFQGNGLWRDPHVIYRRTKDGTLASVKPELGRELWRDAGILLRGGNQVESTVPLMNVADVWLDCPGRLDVEMIGLVTNNEAVLGRVHERLRLPTPLFLDEAKAREFQRALEINEEMCREVDKAVKWQFCHPGDKKKRSNVAQQAVEAFLSQMHGVLFGEYLGWLLAETTFGERVERYMDAMWQALDGPVLREIVEQTGSDVTAIKRQNAVRAKVRKAYRAIWERSVDLNG